jgi:hypothetical protein
VGRRAAGHPPAVENKGEREEKRGRCGSLAWVAGRERRE